MVEFLKKHPQGPTVIVTTHALAQSRRQHFEAMSPHLVVVDEASSLKGQGVRHEEIKWICDDAQRVITMTATPYENNPDELWGLFSLTGIPNLPSREDYLAQFCEVETFSEGDTKVVGWKSPAHGAEVRRSVGPNFLRRTAASVGLALPHRVDSESVLVPLSDQQQRQYRWAMTNWSRGALKRHAYLMKVSRKGKDGVSPLVDAAMEKVLALVAEGAKVVLYAEHIETLEDLSTRLTEAEVGHVTMSGKDDKVERSDAVDLFRTDDATPVLLGTKVLEHGLNLQFANVLVSVGQTYNPGRERQREGRLCRIGSPNATYRHISFLPDTDLTRKQKSTLDQKEADSRAFLDAQ